MAEHYTSTTETVLTAAGQAIVCSALGRAIDSSFPPVDDGKSDLQLALEVGAQFAASYFVTTEVMRAMMPANEGYVSPVGDGTAVYFLLSNQPNLRIKMDDLAGRATAAVRRAMGVPEREEEDKGQPIVAK